MEVNIKGGLCIGGFSSTLATILLLKMTWDNRIILALVVITKELPETQFYD